MGITVNEALKLPALRDAVLVAGKNGLDRVIASVNMMEVPDIILYVKKDEFLVTTTYPIRDNPEAQERLIPNLVQTGVAALAIKPVFYSDEIPPLMLRQADELGFPLIQLPKTASFNEILNPILGEILNRQASVLHRNEEVHRHFTELVLKGGSLVDIATMIASVQDNPLSIHAPKSQLLAFGSPDAATEDYRNLKAACQIPGSLALSIGNRDGRIRIDYAGQAREVFIQHVLVAGENYGFIVLWLERSHNFEINVIEQAVTVIALEIVKLRAITEVERRFKSFFIEEIIQGKIKSRVEAVSRGVEYGWDLSSAFLPILIEIDDYLDLVKVGQAKNHPARIQKLFWNIVSRSAMFHSMGAIVVDIGSRILILLKVDSQSKAGTPKDLAYRLAVKIREEMSSDKHLAVTAGIGRTVQDILDLHEGYSQAERALAIGQQINGSGSITQYSDLGIYRFLSLHENNKELADFCHELLGELIDSDELHHTDFITTLQNLFKCNFNLKQTAISMAVHYNTIRYRVSKIEQLTGVSLDSDEDRLNLQVAFKVHKILQGKLPG